MPRRYGRPHARVKERLVAQWRAAPYPCPRCGLPMTEPAEALDAGHDDARPNEPASRLEHPLCNRLAGPKRAAGNLRPSRTW